MKPIPLLIIRLCMTMMVHAQVSKTIETTAGNLKASLTATELNTITQLTLTGTMDARDFRTIKAEMPLLTSLDLSKVNINSYLAGSGRYRDYYPENTIPGTPGEYTMDYSLRNKVSLTTLRLPNSITAIEAGAFEGCIGLTAITIPPSVITIGADVFKRCSKLATCLLPPSVTTIGEEAFYGCSSLTAIELPAGITEIKTSTFNGCKSIKTIKIPSTVTAIGAEALNDCRELSRIDLPPLLDSLNYSVFAHCVKLTSVNLPPTLAGIPPYAFDSCMALTTITIPRNVSYIGTYAFNDCKNLATIYAYPIQPPQSEDISFGQVFEQVNKTSCILYVPQGSKELYLQAQQWKGFTNITEIADIKLTTNIINLEAMQSSTQILVSSEIEWTAVSDQTWLSIQPASGTGNSTVTITSQPNSTVGTRIAKITFRTGTETIQDVAVTQKGINKAVRLTVAGNLLSAFTQAELRGITQLTIEGNMDARDFKTIRDQMPLLRELNLTRAIISAYSGKEGTIYAGFSDVKNQIFEYFEYPANEIPAMALFKRSTLISVLLPISITGIGDKAFYGCAGLPELLLPTKVTTIGKGAFDGCNGLNHFEIPPQVRSIGEYAFRGCRNITSIDIPGTLKSLTNGLFLETGLTSILIPASVTSMGSGVFFGCSNLTSVTLPATIDSIKDQTFMYCTGLKSFTFHSTVKYLGSSIFFGCSHLTTVTLPPDITSIGGGTFQDCTELTSIRIPSKVTLIGTYAFKGCVNLSSIYSNPVDPPELKYITGVFEDVNKNTCILYVPYGSKQAYDAAVQWKDFKNITEMPGFKVSATKAIVEGKQGSKATFDISSNGPWDLLSDQTWLTVNPSSGVGSRTITLTADSNNIGGERIAHVTVLAKDTESQIITITQQTMAVGVDEMAQNMVNFNCYPNPFMEEMIIKIQNPGHEGMTIDIYNLKGQKIKNLALNDTSEHLFLSWNGTNDQGQPVPGGVYICKMNHLSKQIIFHEP